jgi:hypothetical protein
MKRFPGKFKLFSFYGLRDRQDDASAGWNERNVYYLWATLRKLDSGRVIPNVKGLEVEFRIAFTLPGNVAIRVSKLCVPVSRSGSFRNLRFRACIPPDSPPNVWIGIRVVDALTTHWMYCSEEGKDNRLAVSPGARGQLFTIPLHDSLSWKPFTADGNYCYHNAVPDFSQILAVVIEMGTETSWRPGDDPGKVQLKEIFVWNICLQRNPELRQLSRARYPSKTSRRFGICSSNAAHYLPALPNGLYSAASLSQHAAHTGLRRSGCATTFMVAYSLLANGETGKAAATVLALGSLSTAGQPL